MILGSLLVLQVDDDNLLNSLAKAPDLTSTVTVEKAAEEVSSCAESSSESQLKACLIPVNLSERMLPLAANRDGNKTKRATPNGECNKFKTGCEGSNGNSSQNQERRELKAEARPRRVLQPTGLITCHKLIDHGNGVVPSVLEMQMLVEQAWDAGYDTEGCDIFQPEGVCGNERWIGEKALDFSN